MTTNDPIQVRMKWFERYLAHSGLESKDYQYRGVEWCLRNELGLRKSDGMEGEEEEDSRTVGIKGGFIADEMGLGKTIMMIGTMVAHFVPHTLIVLPVVLIEQWKQCFLKTCGHKVLLYYGSSKNKITEAMLRRAPIVLTSYDGILIKHENKNKNKNKNKEEKENLLHKIKWNRVVFDEAHYLRNKKTQRWQSAQHLNAEIRWFVTGTPIQNYQNDFFHLCELLGICPSYAKKKEHWNHIVKSFVLKRTKREVGILIPPLTIHHETVEWQSKEEEDCSKIIHALTSVSNVDTNHMGHLATVVFNQFANYYGNTLRLTSLLFAKQVCIAPSLLTQTIEKVGLNGLIPPKTNSKLDALMDCLQRNRNNGKGKLVFCHFQREIDMIQEQLVKKAKYEADKIRVLDGRVSHAQKNNILQESNTQVLILQIKTCSEGLNLQEHFSEIYFVTPHWNPFLQDQAIARCHRIGQTQPVDVYHFCMNGFTSQKKSKEEEERLPEISIDTYVDALHETKRKRSQDILSHEDE